MWNTFFYKFAAIKQKGLFSPVDNNDETKQ